jgi:hypothetical protein
MEKLSEAGSYRLQLRRLKEAYKLLKCDTSEDRDCARKWIAAMVRAGATRKRVAEYVERNIREITDEAKGCP